MFSLDRKWQIMAYTVELVFMHCHSSTIYFENGNRDLFLVDTQDGSIWRIRGAEVWESNWGGGGSQPHLNITGA